MSKIEYVQITVPSISLQDGSIYQHGDICPCSEKQAAVICDWGQGVRVNPADLPAKKAEPVKVAEPEVVVLTESEPEDEPGLDLDDEDEPAPAVTPPSFPNDDAPSKRGRPGRGK